MIPDFTLQFDAVNRLLLVTFSQGTTDESVIAAFEAMRTFVAANGPCHIVRDYRALKAAVSPHVIRHLGSLPALVPDEWRHAVVVALPIQFGVSRRLQMLRADSDGDRHHLVRSLEEAWDVFGVAQPQLIPV